MNRKDIVYAIKEAHRTNQIPVFLCRVGAGDVSAINEELSEAMDQTTWIDCQTLAFGDLPGYAEDAIERAKQDPDRHCALLFDGVDKALPEVAENVFLLAFRHSQGIGRIPKNVTIVVTAKDSHLADKMDPCVAARCVFYDMKGE